MAKIECITKSNRGKEIKCSKCGKPITEGMKYYKATPYKRAAIIRCTDCGLKSYETSGSEYIQTVGAIVEDWAQDYGTSDGTAEEIVSALEELRDTCEENLENIPEQLKDADAGMTLQERIDELNDAINELEQISFEDLKDERREEAEEEAGDKDEYDDEEAWEEAVSEELDHLAEEAYEEAINDALSGLSY